MYNSWYYRNLACNISLFALHCYSSAEDISETKTNGSMMEMLSVARDEMGCRDAEGNTGMSI